MLKGKYGLEEQAESIERLLMHFHFNIEYDFSVYFLSSFCFDFVLGSGPAVHNAYFSLSTIRDLSLIFLRRLDMAWGIKLELAAYDTTP